MTVPNSTLGVVEPESDTVHSACLYQKQQNANDVDRILAIYAIHSGSCRQEQALPQKAGKNAADQSLGELGQNAKDKAGQVGSDLQTNGRLQPMSRQAASGALQNRTAISVIRR